MIVFNNELNINDVITIVSGLPRSGTSMMMQMLEAGGMQVVVDNIRKADEDNPRGYYELEIVKKIENDVSWLDACKGRAFKMVSKLLYHLPEDYNYKVIFMKREIAEILTSQAVMLDRRGRRGAEISCEQMGLILEKHLQEVEDYLGKQSSIDSIYIRYNDVINEPLANSKIISEFLNGWFDVGEMVQVVDKALYRQRTKTQST